MCYVRIALCWSNLFYPAFPGFLCFLHLTMCTLIEASQRYFFGRARICGGFVKMIFSKEDIGVIFSVDQVSCTCTDLKTKASRNKCKCSNHLVYGDALTCNCAIFAVTVIITNILLACSTFCPKMIKCFAKKNALECSRELSLCVIDVCICESESASS